MKKKILLFPLLLLVLAFAFVGCGSTEADETSTECAHTNTEWRIERNATCEEEGSKKNVCLSCYQTLESQTIPATGHTYTNNKCTACGSIQISTVAELQEFQPRPVPRPDDLHPLDFSVGIGIGFDFRLHYASPAGPYFSPRSFSASSVVSSPLL